MILSLRWWEKHRHTTHSMMRCVFAWSRNKKQKKSCVYDDDDNNNSYATVWYGRDDSISKYAKWKHTFLITCRRQNESRHTYLTYVCFLLVVSLLFFLFFLSERITLIISRMYSIIRWIALKFTLVWFRKPISVYAFAWVMTSNYFHFFVIFMFVVKWFINRSYSKTDPSPFFPPDNPRISQLNVFIVFTPHWMHCRNQLIIL